MALMHISEILQELESLEPIRQALKERAMIYQADLKDEVAKHFGLAAEKLYHMTYVDWDELRARYLKEKASGSDQGKEKQEG